MLEHLLDGIDVNLDPPTPLYTVATMRCPLIDELVVFVASAPDKAKMHTIAGMLREIMDSDRFGLGEVCYLLAASPDVHEAIWDALESMGWVAYNFLAADPSRARWVPPDTTPQQLAAWAHELAAHYDSGDLLEWGGDTESTEVSEDA